jgi:hypothetical protein
VIWRGARAACSRGVPAHERLRVGERAREHVDVLRRADVAEHHGGVALLRRQLGALHRRAAERHAVALDVHREDLARELPRVLPGERLARLERRVLWEILGEPDVPRTCGLGGVAV